MKTFLGINYTMVINKLSSIAEYWRVEVYWKLWDSKRHGFKSFCPNSPKPSFC